MRDDRWDRLIELFHGAVALPAAQRPAFLVEASGGDPGLRAEVERLCAAHDRAGAFIETPAIAAAGAWLDGAGDLSPVGRRFGVYRIVREIGRGGMGAVYLAERDDGQFRQRVAIKLVKRGMDTDLVLRRFRAERQILASLDHPNIARLLDGGTTEDGRPYFVMEHVHGRRIDEYADAHRLPVPERLRLFLQVCDAVEYAHRQRVVHRDLKPANILVTADGTPKLLDFGIARVLDAVADEPTFEVTGLRLLTPEYASPEQVDGRPATIASDVYSLGVVLYELLTGHSPYRPRSAEPVDVAEAVRTGDPASPSASVSRISPGEQAVPRRPGLETDRAAATGTSSVDRLGRRLRGDLDTIVLMALRKDPERRYASVSGLAEDLRRHLQGLPVAARPDSLRYRGGKFLRRNRSPVTAAALGVLGALLLGAGYVAYLSAAERPLERATPPAAASAAGADDAAVTDSRPLVAITGVRNVSRDTADAWLEAGLPQMLAMGLSRAGLEVMPPARVQDAVRRESARPGAAARERPGAGAEVAARLGANRQVGGSFVHGPGGYTLDLVVRAAPSGVARARISVAAPDLLSAVDQATARLLAALDAPAAGPRLEDVETRSVDAYRAFISGLQQAYEGRMDEAVRAYDAAIAADSGFASAVVQRILATPSSSPALPRLSRLYLRVRDRAPDFDRLTMQAFDALYGGAAARAEASFRALVERYPRDPRAYDFLRATLEVHGRFHEAARVLERRLALDSLATTSPGNGPCQLCASHAALALDYLADGDLVRAEAVARRAIEVQPQRPGNWMMLARALAAQGRHAEALRAQERAVALAGRDPGYAGELVRARIEARQYDRAEETLRAWRRTADPGYAETIADLEAMLLREEGRYREAAATLMSYLARDTTEVALALVLGHTLAAAGQPALAARVYEARSGAHPTAGSAGAELPAGVRARAFAWPHALLADALYLAGSTDTVRLAALADSVQRIGARSYYARDWTLYHHIRGLIAVRAGRWGEAERELTAARFGRSGWTRTLFELAKIQLKVGRPRAALATLRDAHEEPLDGMGRYATRSELDLLTAQAFAAAGQPDSAAVYGGHVRAAWAKADPPLKPRLSQLP